MPSRSLLLSPLILLLILHPSILFGCLNTAYDTKATQELTNVMSFSVASHCAFKKETFQELVSQGADPNAGFAQRDALCVYIYTREAKNVKIPEDLEFFVALGLRIRPLIVPICTKRFNDLEQIHSALSYLLPLIDPLDIDSKDLFSSVIAFCHQNLSAPEIVEFCLKRMEENSFCFSEMAIFPYPGFYDHIPESERPRYLKLCGDDLINSVLSEEQPRMRNISIPLYAFTHFVDRVRPAAAHGSKILRDFIDQGKLEQALVLSSRGYTVPDGLRYFNDQLDSNCQKLLGDGDVRRIYFYHFNKQLDPKAFPDTASILALLGVLFNLEALPGLHGAELRHFRSFLVQHYFPQYILFLQVGIPLPREITLSEIMPKIITTDYQ